MDLDQTADDETLASLRGLSLQTAGKEEGEGEGMEEDRALGDLFLEGQALVEALEEGTEDQEGSEARQKKLERALKLFSGLKVGEMGCVCGWMGLDDDGSGSHT